MARRPGKRCWQVSVAAIAVSLALVGLGTTVAGSMPRYDSGCKPCHGAFTDGNSQTGSTYPNDDKHRMHRSSSHMNTACKPVPHVR